MRAPVSNCIQTRLDHRTYPDHWRRFALREGIHHVHAASYAGPGIPRWLLVLSRVFAENEYHHGGTSQPWEGNTHLRVRLRPQGIHHPGSSWASAARNFTCGLSSRSGLKPIGGLRVSPCITQEVHDWCCLVYRCFMPTLPHSVARSPPNRVGMKEAPVCMVAWAFLPYWRDKLGATKPPS